MDKTSYVHGWCLKDYWIKAGMYACMLYVLIKTHFASLAMQLASYVEKVVV